VTCAGTRRAARLRNGPARRAWNHQADEVGDVFPVGEAEADGQLVLPEPLLRRVQVLDVVLDRAAAAVLRVRDRHSGTLLYRLVVVRVVRLLVVVAQVRPVGDDAPQDDERRGRDLDALDHEASLGGGEVARHGDVHRNPGNERLGGDERDERVQAEVDEADALRRRQEAGERDVADDPGTEPRARAGDDADNHVGGHRALPDLVRLIFDGAVFIPLGSVILRDEYVDDVEDHEEAAGRVDAVRVRRDVLALVVVGELARHPRVVEVPETDRYARAGKHLPVDHVIVLVHDLVEGISARRGVGTQGSHARRVQGEGCAQRRPDDGDERGQIVEEEHEEGVDVSLGEPRHLGVGRYEHGDVRAHVLGPRHARRRRERLDRPAFAHFLRSLAC